MASVTSEQQARIAACGYTIEPLPSRMEYACVNDPVLKILYVPVGAVPEAIEHHVQHLEAERDGTPGPTTAAFNEACARVLAPTALRAQVVATRIAQEAGLSAQASDVSALRQDLGTYWKALVAVAEAARQQTGRHIHDHLARQRQLEMQEG